VLSCLAVLACTFGINADDARAQTGGCTASGSGTTFVIREPGYPTPSGGIAVGIQGFTVTGLSVRGTTGHTSTNGLPAGASLEYFSDTPNPAGQPFIVDVMLNQQTKTGFFITYGINAAQNGYFTPVTCPLQAATTPTTTTTPPSSAPSSSEPASLPPIAPISITTHEDSDWLWWGLIGLGAVLTVSFFGIHTTRKGCLGIGACDKYDDGDDGCDPCWCCDDGDDNGVQRGVFGGLFRRSDEPIVPLTYDATTRTTKTRDDEPGTTDTGTEGTGGTETGGDDGGGPSRGITTVTPVPTEDCTALRAGCEKAKAAADAAEARARALAAAAAQARAACQAAGAAVTAAQAEFDAAVAAQPQPGDSSWVEDAATGNRVTVADTQAVNQAAQAAWNRYRSGEIDAQQLEEEWKALDSPGAIRQLRDKANQARANRVDAARRALDAARQKQARDCAAADQAEADAATAAQAAQNARHEADAACKAADECEGRARGSGSPGAGGTGSK
jgi:hypothetical protein